VVDIHDVYRRRLKVIRAFGKKKNIFPVPTALLRVIIFYTVKSLVCELILRSDDLGFRTNLYMPIVFTRRTCSPQTRYIDIVIYIFISPVFVLRLPSHMRRGRLSTKHENLDNRFVTIKYA